MTIHQDEVGLSKLLLEEHSESPLSLSNASEKDKPWETHRMVADDVHGTFLSSSSERQVRRGKRMLDCGPYLIFKLLQDPGSEDILHKLRYAQFCHVRLCPICMWRRSLAWRARFYEAWPRIFDKYPKARYFHLVLTVPNCEISELREIINRINIGWHRMASRKTWPALGFIRSLEVTRSQKGLAHPHVHALMMVPTTYFTTGYMNREDWREYWASALRVKTDSIIHPYVRAVKGGPDEVSKLVLEIAKYAVKMKSFASMMQAKPKRAWFLELDSQLESTKSVTLGGVIKDLMKNDEIEEAELLQLEEKSLGEFIKDVRYDWFTDEKLYLRTKFLENFETEYFNRQEQKMIEKIREKHAGRTQKREEITLN